MTTFVKNDDLKDLFAPISSKKKFEYLKSKGIAPMCSKEDSKGRIIYIFDNNEAFKNAMTNYSKK